MIYFYLYLALIWPLRLTASEDKKFPFLFVVVSERTSEHATVPSYLRE